MDREKKYIEYGKRLKAYNFDIGEYWAYPKNGLEGKIKTLPNSGFKIHISATAFNAIYIFDKVIEYLLSTKIPFKIISSLKVLENLNSGIYGFSQIGKFITIYPDNYSDLNNILENLYLLTKGINSIQIPSDFSYKKSSVIFYRYGTFISDVKLIDGKEKYMLTLPNGEKIEDVRQRNIPPEVDISIEDYFIKKHELLPKNYIIIDLLRKRGKGGVYKAVDLTAKKRVILKEGVSLGEIETSGFDGRDRVMWEMECLKNLAHLNFVPNILNYFYVSNNFFLVQEFIEGKPLRELITEEILDDYAKIKIILNTSKCVAVLHDMGYILRDLSPDNIIVNSDNNKVKIIDFEFCHRINEKSPPYIKVGSIGFYDSEKSTIDFVDDIYSLCSILYYLYNPKEYKVLLEENGSNKNVEHFSIKKLNSIKDDYILDIIKSGLNYKFNEVNDLVIALEDYMKARRSNIYA